MEIKKFILRTALFIVLVFTIDYLMSLGLSRFATSSQNDHRIELILKGNNDFDVVIFGSSRAARNIRASELSKELKIKAYNFGFLGSNIDFHELLLNYYLKSNNKKPKLIVLALDDTEEFFEKSNIGFRLDYLYPWIKYPLVKETINEREPFTYLSLSKAYPYKKCNLPTLYKTRGTVAPTDTIVTCGSMPIRYKSLTFDTMQFNNYFTYNKSKESPYLIDKFTSFLSLCKKNNINLLLVYGPNYAPRINQFSQRIIELSKGNNNIFFYQNTNEKFKEKQWFCDKYHLNYRGGMIFSKDLANYISTCKLLID
ncbi:MAG: hypothetical protein ACO3EE_06930 [Flavobacteriales bacterium]